MRNTQKQDDDIVLGTPITERENEKYKFPMIRTNLYVRSEV